jgi:RNA 3'-terminal phosphate cyclase (ATP)
MIEIDGRSGGGQILRTALTLSAVTGESFKIDNIRGNRPNPGLKNQHLKCVETMARLCDAEVDGAENGSKSLVFRPSNLEPKNFTVNIGTAGSVTLLLDTVLPVTTQFNTDFRLNVKGGTDVKWSPTFNYLKDVKMDLLKLFGWKGALELERTGFYPEGGGEVRLDTADFSMKNIDTITRGEIKSFEVFSKASTDLEDRDVADRQADELERKLKNSHISVLVEKNVSYVDTGSTGSSLVLKAVYENSVAGFDSLGERGMSSEAVAANVYRAFRNFHSSDAAADEFMADQLPVFMAIVGGRIRISELTSHVQSCVEVIRKFGFEMEIIDEGPTYVLRS